MFQYPSKTRRNSSLASAKKSFAQGVTETLWVAGRVIGMWEKGDGPFGVEAPGFVLQDETDRLDVVQSDELARQGSLQERTLNVGDIVEVNIRFERKVDTSGKTIEVYLAADVVTLAPCTDEFFIRKEDPHYRRMIIDRSVQEILKKRMVILAGIRKFFSMQGFDEVETPSLVKLPGMEPYLDVFSTRFFEECKNGICKRPESMYLITSPEYAMKKLLVGGYEKIFQICKSFRNKEAKSELHNPEFTLLEWYRSYSDYEDIMKDTESIVDFLAQEVHGTSQVPFKDTIIDTTPPWPRIKVKDLFKDYAGIAVEDFENPEKFRSIVAKKGYSVDANTSFDDLFFLVFMNEIEPKLGVKKPVIVYEYPVSMAALSKKSEQDSRYAQRFEVYMGGVELCNAFTELNDPVEQEARLQQERIDRQKMGKDDYPVDQSFIRALQFAMPPAAGNALGVDRLVMLLLNRTDIRDVLFFPHDQIERL